MTRISSKLKLPATALAHGLVAVLIFWVMKLWFEPDHSMPVEQALAMMLGFALGRLIWDVSKLAYQSRRPTSN